MARVLHDWLASFQELPVAGIGLLSWRRQSAELLSDRKTIQSPGWSLVFDADPSVEPSPDFFDRLATLNGSDRSALEQQYRDWLKKFNGTEPSVDLWGMGTLVKDTQGVWSGHFTQQSKAPSIQLDRLPIIEKPVFVRWVWSDRLVLILLMLALGWLIWLAAQSGFRLGAAPFKPSYQEMPMPVPAPTYRELF